MGAEPTAQGRGDDRAVRQGRGRLATLGLIGAAAQIFFALAANLLPFVSDLSFVDDTISALANGRYGAIQTTAFFVSGGGTLLLAYGLRATTRGARGSLPGAILVGLLGVGAIAVGLFPTDRAGQGPTITGTIHIAAAVGAFIAITLGLFTLVGTFRQTARWRSFWRPTLIFACVALVALLAQLQRDRAGLTERIFVGTTTLWQIVAALRLYRDARAGARAGDNLP